MKEFLFQKKNNFYGKNFDTSASYAISQWKVETCLVIFWNLFAIKIYCVSKAKYLGCCSNCL